MQRLRVQFFLDQFEKVVPTVLNQIMTHSPRMAAWTTNKRFGPDVERDPMTIHRMELKKRVLTAEQTNQAPAAEQLREQTA